MKKINAESLWSIWHILYILQPYNMLVISYGVVCQLKRGQVAFMFPFVTDKKIVIYDNFMYSIHTIGIAHSLLIET